VGAGVVYLFTGWVVGGNDKRKGCAARHVHARSVSPLLPSPRVGGLGDIVPADAKKEGGEGAVEVRVLLLMIFKDTPPPLPGCGDAAWES
jgi:hypothetical protein